MCMSCVYRRVCRGILLPRRLRVRERRHQCWQLYDDAKDVHVRCRLVLPRWVSYRLRRRLPCWKFLRGCFGGASELHRGVLLSRELRVREWRHKCGHLHRIPQAVYCWLLLSCRLTVRQRRDKCGHLHDVRKGVYCWILLPRGLTVRQRRHKCWQLYHVPKAVRRGVRLPLGLD